MERNPFSSAMLRTITIADHTTPKTEVWEGLSFYILLLLIFYYKNAILEKRLQVVKLASSSNSQDTSFSSLEFGCDSRWGHKNKKLDYSSQKNLIKSERGSRRNQARRPPLSHLSSRGRLEERLDTTDDHCLRPRSSTHAGFRACDFFPCPLRARDYSRERLSLAPHGYYATPHGMADLLLDQPVPFALSGPPSRAFVATNFAPPWVVLFSVDIPAASRYCCEKRATFMGLPSPFLGWNQVSDDPRPRNFVLSINTSKILCKSKLWK